MGNKLTVVIDTLSAQTKYFYRTFVTVNDLYYYGEKRSFTTKDFSNITSTGEASNLTFTSAKIDCKADAGSIDRDNNYAIGVAYSLSKSQLHPDSILVYRKIVTCPIDSVKNKSYEITISRLQTGKTYYYCSFTRAGSKFKLGEIKSFSTKSLSASPLSTGDATDVTFTSATIKNTSTIASMYPKNTSISYGVRYSISKESLAETSFLDGFVGNLYFNPNTGERIYLNNGSVVDGNSFTIQLRNLTSGTTYYYCAYVSVDGITLTGEIKSFTTKDIKDIQTTGSVDLGVSCKWAACNLGSTTPEDYGDYYAWGETETRTFFYSSNYSHYRKDIGTEISGTSYDAARKVLGSPWRMPTKSEFQELLDKCFWQEITYKNTTGFLVTGMNGNAIFLPRTGYKYDNTSGSGYGIWTGTYYYYSSSSSQTTYASYWSGWSGSTLGYIERYYGLTIRPVQD